MIDKIIVSKYYNFLLLLSNYRGKKLDMRVDSFDDILELHNDGGHGELFLEGHCIVDNDKLGQNMKALNRRRMGRGNLNQPHH